MIILIKEIDLSTNRNFIFESDQLKILTFSINIVNYNLSRIVIRNNIDLLITFIKYVRFNKMLKYEAEKCFQIDLKNAFMIEKLIKKIKSKFLIKRIFQKLLCIIAIFNIEIIIIAIKIKHHINVMIYNNVIIIQIIIDVIKAFLNL